MGIYRKNTPLFFFDSVQLYKLSTFVTCHGMFFLCICIVYVRYVFLRVAGFFLTQTGISCLHPLHVMGWLSYVFALYTFVTLFERCIWFIFFWFSSAVYTCLRSLHVMGCFSYVFALYTFVTFFWEMLFFSHTNRHLLCTTVTCHGMVFLCFALYTFVTLFERCIWFIFFFIQFSCINCLRSLHVIRCFSYVFALYTFVTFFWELLVFFSHKQASLVYIRYMSCEGFSYVFALYTFVTLFERCIWFIFFWFSSAVYTCLRSLHVFRCFSYVSVLYTFVTFFERLTGFFFNKQALSTSVTCLRMVFLCISAVYIRYTIWYSDNLDSSQLYVGGYTIFFPRSTPNNMFASSTFVYAVTV